MPAADATPPTRPLAPSVAAFVQSGLSVTVAARNDRLVPSISKAVGCRVEHDGRQVTVLLFADVAEAVCRDIAANGQVAVCFSRPSTHETVQVKGRDARFALAAPQDVATARGCLDRLIDDLVSMGFERRTMEAFFWGDPKDLVAIRFTADSAFAQTPGPSAGRALPV